MFAETFDDRCCALGEGPLWHHDRQSLFWFDIDNKKLFEKKVGGIRAEFDFDRTVSAAGIVDSNRILIASERDLFVFDLETKQQKVLCELESDNPVNRSNDGRADSRGGFWIGTMGYNAEPNSGAIYRFYLGELRQMFSGISIPNSICFSPEGSTAFFTDSVEKIIWRVDLDEHGWPASIPEPFVNLQHEEFAPDGAVVDAAGKLWSAQWMASRVAVYSQDGEFIESHSLPTSQTTCPSFGGQDLSTLFVTSAGDHLPDGLVGTQPMAGFVFKIEGVGPGQAEHRVIVD